MKSEMKDLINITDSLSTEEKISFCSGKDFWHTKEIPKYSVTSLMLSDGPNGLRKQDGTGGTDMLGINNSAPATCFPSASLTACSFDPSVTEEIGEAIGEEAAALNVDIVLGPGANLKRNPLCGRNFEYFSEDPLVTGKMAAGWIRGIESTRVSSCLKHFACNNQETKRFQSDSIMDERTLREMYLRGFEIAVKEGNPSSVMSAYNKLNGVHCSDNKALLTDILRDEWGFDGLVVTDWGGMSDRIEGFRAGCDLSMPGGSDYMEKETAAAVRNGKLDERDIDRSVIRILSAVQKAEKSKEKNAAFDAEKHFEIARKAAEKSAVLLKNDEDIFPLDSGKKVVLIGDMAKNMRYQGAGSSHINAIKTVSPCEAMPDIPWCAGYLDDGSTNDELIENAVSSARASDVAVVFAGLPASYESEGSDRENMKMPDGQVRLIDAVSEANENTAVILFCGAPIECPWAERVKTILYMGLPGEAGGEAVKNLIFGIANPSGKLAESWPVKYEDCASSEIFAKTKTALYEEGIYVGYHYYEKAGIPVRFPFGHGLSYTSFEYSRMTVNGRKISVTVKNTGKIPGAETVLLWISAPQNGIHRPKRELKAFDKVFLQPTESKTVSFVLDDRAFTVWQDGWKIQEGYYTVWVGGFSEAFYVSGENIAALEWQSGSWYENCTGKPNKKDFENALCHEVISTELQKGKYTMDNSVEEMKKHSLIMKIMYSAVESTVAKGFGGKKDYSNPDFRMMMNASAGAPLRCMQISGGIKGGLFQGLLEMANGHFFKGIIKMIKG